MLTIAIANSKPGTGKTTTAVWLAAAFASRGNTVLLVDADPAGSAGQWNELAGFTWATMDGSRESYLRQAPDTATARGCDVVIIDCPQVEDHPRITNLAMRLADEVLIPCAPTVIEIERTSPMRQHIGDVDSLRAVPLRACVLLNRTVTFATSTAVARETFAELGFDVLETTVPRREAIAQSFGTQVDPLAGSGFLFSAIAAELAERDELAEVSR